MALNLWRRVSAFLVVLNLLLLAAAWAMAIYVYPRIPPTMAAPLSVLGLSLGSKTKSVLFFLCPAVQTLLTTAAVVVGRVAARRSKNIRHGALRQEHIYLGMVFVNVIFIHIERNVISLAEAGRSSLNAAYLVVLTAIVFLVYLYYRLRLKTPAP